MRADEDALTELRGFKGWGPRLDVLAAVAADLGRLRKARNTAMARTFDDVKSSLITSATVAPGRLFITSEHASGRWEIVFYAHLERELSTVLGLGVIVD